MKLEDGIGKGFSAEVDSKNRLHTYSTSVPEALDATEAGDGYNVNTGQIALTAAGTLIYIKNNETKDLIVEAIALGNDGAGTHSANPYITIVRNPTGGDLITDATAVSMNQNRNFSSSKTLTADVYKGKVSGTLTGGNDIAILQAATAGRDFYTINMALPQGASLGIKYTANLSSGTANVYAALVCYLRTNGA
jgi:hypothetical protein